MFFLLFTKVLNRQEILSVKANRPLQSGVARPHTERPWSGQWRTGTFSMQPTGTAQQGSDRIAASEGLLRVLPTHQRIAHLLERS